MGRERGPAAGSVKLTPPLLEGERLTHDPMRVAQGGNDRSSATFEIPTLLMRSMMQRGIDAGLPLAADKSLIARLNPSGTHLFSQVHRVEADGAEWARGSVRLSLRDDPSSAYVAWLDVDLEMMGRLIDATRRAVEVRTGYGGEVPLGHEGVPVVQVAPRWAGSHAFAHVYRRTGEIAQMVKIQGGQIVLPTRQAMAVSEVSLLAHAHVLVVPPEQVAVLPEWEHPQEAFDYIDEAQLPFEPLFLDFTAPGGLGPTIEFGGVRLEMKGALVWRQPLAVPSAAVMIAPYGGMKEIGAAVFRGERYTPDEWESVGWFAFGSPPIIETTGEVSVAGEVTLGLLDTPMYGSAASLWANACADVEQESPLPGYAIMPFPLSTIREKIRGLPKGDPEAEKWGEHLKTWGELVWTYAAKALAALSITEAVEVEFVEAAMLKRDRKRAVKRGWPIAQQVVIRSHQKRYRDHTVTGEEAHYSHRFWRRATVAHYPLGTRLADARPDLVTPCRREPERNCGFCRKVKRPACIVGPEDRPLVLKTLKRQG